jgi:hypothetical protein
MNIDDVENPLNIPVTDYEMVVKIFEGQMALIHKYEPIEARNGAVIPTKVGEYAISMSDIQWPAYSIDDSKVQARLKDMFWRATEELAEAFEFYPTYGEVEEGTSSSFRHCVEELIDAVHFMTEASIIAMVSPTDVARMATKSFERSGLTATSTLRRSLNPEAVASDPVACDRMLWNTIRYLGLAANTLKNKPWKQSQMATDAAMFRSMFLAAWYELFGIISFMGLSMKDVFIFYHKKHAVNQFRQRSNY